jgi:saccharopine dehydrogenase-like NADP-dependent oxidoreductase
MTRPLIAVYGAAGHTGTLVALELARRGHEVVLGGRSRASLDPLRDRLETNAAVTVATVGDGASLRRLTGSASVLINCAGPFATTGEAIAAAAVDTGTHYVDHSAEPGYVRRLFDVLSARARAADVAVMPGMSFYGALADLLAHRVAAGRSDIDELTVAYAVRGWRMTAASKATALSLHGSDRLVFVDGSLRTAPARSDPATFTFPSPVGDRTVIVDYPAGEVVTIPRHVAARGLRVLMTADTFTDGAVFDSEEIESDQRAGSTFMLAVRAETQQAALVGHLTGVDIYATGAVVSVEAAARLAADPPPTAGGVLGAAEVFPATPFLDALEARGAVHQGG